MIDSAQALLERLGALNIYRHGERRAPHKPLLLLLAIARLRQGQERLSYAEVEAALRPLLEAYAPPVAGRHSPDNPYWYLRSDGLWEVDEAPAMARTRSGYPTMAAFRASSGHLPAEVAALLRADPALAQRAVGRLLSGYFPASLHQDLLDAVGYREVPAAGVAEARLQTYQRRARDAAFREAVLSAYGHRCAFSGFQARLGESFVGCEAAHVHWHAYAGADSVANGLALEPTLHKLFDAGAWSLTDDRRILVAAELTGSEEALERIRARHGQPLRAPLPGQPPIDLASIRWHREPTLGGVFRAPALPL
jgi:putative restriction endonuclease